MSQVWQERNQKRADEMSRRSSSASAALRGRSKKRPRSNRGTPRACSEGRETQGCSAHSSGAKRGTQVVGASASAGAAGRSGRRRREQGGPDAFRGAAPRPRPLTCVENGMLREACPFGCTGGGAIMLRLLQAPAAFEALWSNVHGNDQSPDMYCSACVAIAHQGAAVAPRQAGCLMLTTQLHLSPFCPSDQHGRCSGRIFGFETTQ